MITLAQKISQSHSCISDNIGKGDQVHLLSLDYYLYEKIYACMDRIVDPNNSLHNIDGAHCRALAESFGLYRYDYARHMMKVYYSSSLKPEGPTYATAMHEVDCMRLLKDGYCKEMLDGLC